MSLRTQLGGPYLCRSRDAGESWSTPQPSGLEGPESCTCLRRIPDTDALLLSLTAHPCPICPGYRWTILRNFNAQGKFYRTTACHENLKILLTRKNYFSIFYQDFCFAMKFGIRDED
jgi:hypothetical protein